MRKLLVALLLLGLGALAADRLLLPGLYSARPTPPAVEMRLATWLLRHSVATADADRRNPLPADEATLAAGAGLFQRNCATCHGFDGRGHTQLGGNLYPRVPSLHALMPSLTDGQAFAYIRDGIRNTAMPAWTLPDEQLWQLVGFLRHLPLTAAPQTAASAPADATFVGSAACQSCHVEIFQRWSKTRMANVVRDPATHPDAIIPDLSIPDPLLNFTKADIAFVYGSRWKQRYFTRRGDDFFPLPAQWDIGNKRWLPYHVPDHNADWWAAYYPSDNMARPTGPLCDGCHSVNYNIKTKTPTEWNVGCESCHGPGSAHVAHPTAASIINPAKLDAVAANDTCIGCHSQGRPPGNPIEGKYYDWPVGFHQGLRLADFWQLEEHRPGELTFTHFPDGTAHKNRMQGNDFVQSLMYTRGVTCFSCHDPHGSPNVAMLRAKANALCLTCHAPATQTGPQEASIEAHTHHHADSAGSQCVACHMPKIEETLGKTMVHAHSFKFIPPAQTTALAIPNACTLCHTDKSPEWASKTLAGWPNVSPWRMAP